MMKVKYTIPLPNYGNEYRLSEDELVKLLDKAYASGFSDAKNLYDEKMRKTTVAVSKEWQQAQEIGDR
jgi:hypothetical protein